ncbi:hypothetical protein ACFP1I_11470 [Dyadobacter subterraneus]|uniref:Uncharacterized protein n=1 Tax=Dyadobacter subterraneus TaxID=2773304 RepID=A0ABR9WDP0_9BACT|nr:hypothetical protein [Dyadobacter subterraneus]MBE9463540.1 hypothetical protein [Dyadobacter subterraneus]
MSESHQRRLKILFLISLPVLGSLFWYFIKVFQFQGNQEEFSDGMLALQLSRGWLEGRPLLYDNFYGDHARQHNYYFIPLTGLLTKFTGIYGLFLAYLGLFGVFFWQWFSGFKRFGTSLWTTNWLAVVFFVFGPMGYFIYLDYFGWHPEHYFLPLMALFALNLAKRKYAMAAVWLLLTFLVKETSNILICSLLLFCSVVDFLLTDAGKPWFSYFLNKRNLIVASVCLLLFCLSMGWLSHLNGPQPSRLGTAISRIQQSATPVRLITYISIYLVIGLIALIMGLFPFAIWLRSFKRRGIILGVLACGYSLLFVVYFFETLYYFPTIYMSVSYPPRIGGLWALMLSAYVFISYRFSQAGIMPAAFSVTYIYTGLVFQLILSSFIVSHRFVIDSDSRSLGISASKFINTRFGLNPYPDGNAHQLHELAKKLPEGSDVMVPNQYISYFQNVYPGSWNYEEKPPMLLRRPLLYVYEKSLIGKVSYYKFPQKGYRVIPNHQLLILADSKWYNQRYK